MPSFHCDIITSSLRKGLDSGPGLEPTRTTTTSLPPTYVPRPLAEERSNLDVPFFYPYLLPLLNLACVQYAGLHDSPTPLFPLPNDRPLPPKATDGGSFYPSAFSFVHLASQCLE